MIEYTDPWLQSGETLICFGDSLTAAQDGYVALLQKELEPRGIQVINAGRGGDKTPWALTRLQEAVIDRKPDAVSIFLGTNDAAVGRGCWADEPRVEPAVYKGNLIWMVHLCRLYAGVKKFSIATPAWRFEAETLNEQGDILTHYCQAAREAADESGSRLVPLDMVFAQAWTAHAAEAKNGYLFTRDGTHMTPTGNAMIAEAMLQTWRLK